MTTRTIKASNGQSYTLFSIDGKNFFADPDQTLVYAARPEYTDRFTEKQLAWIDYATFPPAGQSVRNAILAGGVQ